MIRSGIDKLRSERLRKTASEIDAAIEYTSSCAKLGRNEVSSHNIADMT